MSLFNPPLAGLKVLDFSTLLPGPYATMLLADLGAEVLRIESPTRPDMLRLLPPFVGGDARNPNAVSAAHATINRNKQSLALDLKDPRAGDVVRRLLAEYDTVVEQFRPGVMTRLGLDYQSLRETRPDLIYCSITGYGQDGPLRQRAGHDINYLALSGLASYSGREDTGPVLAGTQIADIGGGAHHAAMAILAAAYRRAQNGEGSLIDISMTDCAFALNAVSGANALAGAPDPQPGSELLNGGSHYDYYSTADGRTIAVGSLEPQFAQQFFDGLGQPEWAARLTQPQAHAALKEDIRREIGARSLAHWRAVFADRDACVEPVLSFSEAAESDLLQQRHMVCDVRLPNGDKLRQINSPFRFDNAKPDYHEAGAALGAHSREVLAALGYPEEEIDQLQADGVIV